MPNDRDGGLQQPRNEEEGKKRRVRPLVRKVVRRRVQSSESGTIAPTPPQSVKQVDAAEVAKMLPPPTADNPASSQANRSVVAPQPRRSRTVRTRTAAKKAPPAKAIDAAAVTVQRATQEALPVAATPLAESKTPPSAAPSDSRTHRPRPNMVNQRTPALRSNRDSGVRNRRGHHGARSDGATLPRPPARQESPPDSTLDFDDLYQPQLEPFDRESELPFDTEVAGSHAEVQAPSKRMGWEPQLHELDEFVDDEVSDDGLAETRSENRGTRTMLINVSGEDECRVAVLQEGKLEELFIERASSQSHVGNIYKGRVTNVEPSIQAVFVDFGLKKNGFLHISDVQPQYFPDHNGQAEEVGRKIPRHLRPLIQRCFRRGQELIVQVIKEGVGTKGPTLSTYMSIPGRYLVMMPGMHRHGVSRKIEDETARRKMKTALDELKLPDGMGFILRTAGLDRTKRDLQRDLNYLMRLWKTVVDRVMNMSAPAELYKESDLKTRAIRDLYMPDFDSVLLDDAEMARRAQEFLQIAMPRSKTRVELYSSRVPLFHRYGVEQEIERINARHVALPSGGSLVVDTTEALTAIDVNSGKFRSISDAEETAYKINIEAAEEIARQLRLRDLGGLILCDFIDMRLDRHKRAVERSLRDALKKHKERARILKMSAFGIIEMTRQRRGPSIKRNIYYDCPHCKGSGLVKMPESVMLDVMRTIQLAADHENVQRVTVTVATDVAFQILNTKRAVVSQIESETGKSVMIRGDAGFTSDQVDCVCADSQGQAVTLAASSIHGKTVRSPRDMK
ncbi:MAG: Rne/Rng family ribonuclease [Planctomycetota bacterium]